MKKQKRKKRSKPRQEMFSLNQRKRLLPGQFDKYGGFPVRQEKSVRLAENSRYLLISEVPPYSPAADSPFL